ncbi:MAG: substrate-binding domain-containing protein [Acidimicrobiia bacterium]|nr:substrate-binding domain-containing protein [Acidimicrobiia bacterium]
MSKSLRHALTAVAALSLLATACADDDGTDTSQDTGGATTGGPATGDTEPTAISGGDTTGDTGTAPGSTTGGTGTAPGSTTGDTVDVVQGADLTFHVITHGDDGVFWAVAQKGAEQAGADLGVTVKYFGANNDAEAQSQAIEAAIAEGSDGIAISLADPEGVSAAAQAVTDAGIPLYTLNSGLNNYQELGAVTHVGQTETVAGEGAGERFNELGATSILCARQEQTNIALEERCEGLASTFEGEVKSEFVGLDADPTEQENQIAALLQANPDIDAVMGTGPNIPLRAIAAGEAAGRELIIGGFDISPDVIGAIEDGSVAFTVDQQQYLQGYLPVVLMYLQATNLNTAGGGLPILTGPGFVTNENVEAVKALVEAGTR